MYLLANWKKTYHRNTEFSCLPWKPPVGGGECDKCNLLDECSEYACKSLGQACEIVNKGTKEQKCTWKNPGDVLSPQIKVMGVNGYKLDSKSSPPAKIFYKYDYKVDADYALDAKRPTATGIRIYPEGSEEGCLEAYTP